MANELVGRLDPTAAQRIAPFAKLAIEGPIPMLIEIDPTIHDLAGYLVCDIILRWHQHLQDMLAALTLGQQLLDELEQILQRIPSDRAPLLSDGELTLCERKSFRFRS